METGCVHIYTGDGKGKTTAATGLAVRAAGQGLRVGFCQFLKTGTSGEISSLEKLGVWVASPTGQNKFLWEMDAAEKAECQRRQQETLAAAAAAAKTLDLLVLDEVVCAAAAGMLDMEELAAFVREKPAGLELVLTGRGATPELCALAEYVTEMHLVAHPYEKGQAARQGIEY